MLLLALPPLLIYVIGGWICGILLAIRTRKLAGGYYPWWRKISKAAWILAIAGWCAQFLNLLLVYNITRAAPSNNTLHGYQAIVGVTKWLWFTTLFCPLLWIAAWFMAKRPDPPVAPTQHFPEAEGVWPPTPTAPHDS